MKPGQNLKLIVAASAAITVLALNPRITCAQRSAGAGTHAIAPSQPAKAATADAAPTRTQNVPTAAPAAQKPVLADFAWLEGRWQGTWGPRSAEQCWSSPKAGMMLGTFRLVENGKTLVIEMFTLVEKPDGINLYIRHFTPDLVPWEKTDATVLSLTSLDGPRTTFENAVNGQPKHSIFIRQDAETFISRSEIVPDSGDMQVIEITYHRQKPPAATPSSGGNAARR